MLKCSNSLMAVTPLYKFLKNNGTTFFAFPGAAEDISAAYQNDNFTMNFSKFALLNIPRQNITPGPDNDPVTLDFESAFEKASLNVAADYKDQLVESLRNYVANHEVTIRETKISDNEYFYDNNALETTTEKIFWKWCRKLNLIDFEPAVPEDEYFSNLPQFERNNVNEDDYLPEILWKERETTEWGFSRVYQGTSAGTYSNPLAIEFLGTTNLREGDIVTFQNIENTNINFLNGLQLDVIESNPAGLTAGQEIKFAYTYTGSTQTDEEGSAKLVYNKLLQYIGEITAVNNVQEANRSYTEVYAHIGDHHGQTPDVLFRTLIDVNYKPNLEYPVLPSQYQPEIWGAENFNSPIVSTPQNYPGDYFGQFDTENFVYETSSGDSLRRSGDYYGQFGDINDTTIDPTNIDGLSVDFNTDHYAKMNIINQELDNFDEFNAFPVNNEPPKDFEFNAILWYYTVTDIQGNEATNLYGITFLDNPQNNPDPDLSGIKIPTYKKFVNNGEQDGTSYAFSLNLNFNIINDNIQPSFNPNNINNLFSFNLFNEAMKRLASANNSFNEAIAEHDGIKNDIEGLKGLIYSQTDLNTINNRINNLDQLLQLYQTLQLSSTDTIEVIQNNSTTPPSVELHTRDGAYISIENVRVTNLYNTSGAIPYNINVPDGKNFMVRVFNDDETELDLPNEDRLSIFLDRDLDYKQSVDIVVDGSSTCTQNKQLDIFVNFVANANLNDEPILTELATNLDLPIYYNTQNNQTNTARNWNKFDLNLDLNQDVTILPGELLEIGVPAKNGLVSGDTYQLENFLVGATNSVDYSGQYELFSVATASNTIQLDFSNNQELVDFADTQILPYQIHGGSQSTLNSLPYLSINKGYKITITRVSNNDGGDISKRYLVELSDSNFEGGAL